MGLPHERQEGHVKGTQGYRSEMRGRASRFQGNCQIFDNGFRGMSLYSDSLGDLEGKIIPEVIPFCFFARRDKAGRPLL